MKKNIYLILLTIIITTGCSVKRYLPPGERLYRSSSIKVEKNPETKSSAKSLKTKLKLAVKPRPNKFLLNQPWKVWWWYKLGGDDSTRKEKGLKAFLRSKLAEPPVVSSRINTKTTSENMMGLMENLGYFHTTAQGDTVNTGSYFTKARYTVQVQPQYFINDITWVSDSSELLKILQAEQQTRNTLLKPGKPYTLSDITFERNRLDLFIKTKGYYFFNPDYIMAYADSTIGGRKVSLLMNIKKTTPDIARHPSTINSITIFPNYSLVSKELDTSRSGLEMYDSLYIRDTLKKFKPSLFAETITYRPGSLYSSTSQNTTLNRLINLGAFKFVKNRFQPIADSNRKHRMDVTYYLTPSRKKSLQSSIDGFSKDNNYLGGQASINMRNRNTFGRAELLTIRAFGGFEVSVADSLKNNNNLRLGGEVSLRIPRYVIPFFKVKDNFFYPPNTSIIAGYELLRKQLFYTKNLFKVQYEVTRRKNLVTQTTFVPISISYLQATNVTDTFLKQTIVSPSLLLNIYDEAILGTVYSYTYNRSFPSLRNKWYANGSIDLSGNIAGLISGAKNFREKKIFGTPFAQYVKIDFDIHYTRRLPGVSRLDWANRLQIGIGMPYNNSALLPFAKQYIIGGSSSIRGFNVRSVGPGTYKPTAEDQRFFQIIGGDYKILGNTELRIPLAKIINGAVFFDAGNIWTKDTILFGKAGQFSKNWFKEIAVATGVGLRFDATVILIRVDLGMPLRKPYLPEGERWVLDKIDFGSKAWRKENLILNIALGYPF
ncbi:MAG: BamA/TamA family outer membrane protein [Ferruginibacter sp.]